MLKKILAVTALVLAVAGFSALLWFSLCFASRQRSGLVCTRVDINIVDDGVEYLHNNDIARYLADSGIVLKGRRMDDIDASRVESVLSGNRFVAGAQVFMTRDSVLRMQIRKRKPVLKVIPLRGEIFQIDESGVMMPLTPDYREGVRVAGGYIPASAAYGRKVTALAPRSREAVLAELYRINGFIAADPLWDALFGQIYVTKNGEIELIPIIGGQTVLLGKVADDNDLRNKLERLRLFYTKAGSEEVFNKYSKLNLKYKNQLVATKK